MSWDPTLHLTALLCGHLLAPIGRLSTPFGFPHPMPVLTGESSEDKAYQSMLSPEVLEWLLHHVRLSIPCYRHSLTLIQGASDLPRAV